MALKKFGPYYNSEKQLPIKLVARIKVNGKLLRGVAPYLDIEDVTNYGAETALYKAYILYDNTTNLSEIERIENADTLQLSDFAQQVVSGNVVGFVAQLADKADELDTPLDEESNPLSIVNVGSAQSYMAVVTLEAMPIKITDDSTGIVLMTVISRTTDDGSLSLPATPDLDVNFEGINGFTLVDEGLENEHWYAEFATELDILVNVLNAFKEVTTVSLKNGANSYRDEVVVPDGDAYWGDATDVLQGPVALQSDFQYGGMANLIETFTLNAEDPTQSVTREFDIRIDFPIDSLIKTDQIGIKASGTQTVDSIGTTAGDVTIQIGDDTTTVAVDPTVQTTVALMGDHIASNASITGITLTGNGDGTFVIESDNVGSLYNLPITITSVEDQTFTTQDLTGGSGEADSNQVPTSTQLDLAGEDIVEATYQFKNYLYIVTDRTNLDPNNLEIEWKKNDGVDTYKTLATTPTILELADTGLAKDLIRVPIPIFGEPFNVRVKDTAVNATGRELSGEAEYFNVSAFASYVDEFINPISKDIFYSQITFITKDEFINPIPN